MTDSALPTRSIRVLADYNLFDEFLTSDSLKIFHLIRGLRELEYPINITVGVLIANDVSQARIHQIKNFGVNVLQADDRPYTFAVGETTKARIRKAILAKTTDGAHCRMLLSVAESEKADVLLTNAPALLEAKYALYQDHLIRIVSLHEFGDLCEIMAHGHSVFRSATDGKTFYTIDMFYQMAHWKGSRLARWWFVNQPKLSSDDLKDNLRSAILQRYPFILLARDMTRFYELQLDHNTRHGRMRRFVLPMGYHVNNFYLHLWGMLDQLTLIAKYRLDLPLLDKQCGIASKVYWEEMKARDRPLTQFIKGPKIANWIKTMSDMRHRAAHNVIPMPTEILSHTPESSLSDDDIWSRILADDEDLHLFPKEMQAVFKETMVWHWRIDKMKRVAKDIVYIKRADSHYFWSPVLSIDHDLMFLNAVIDAFLVRIFARD